MCNTHFRCHKTNVGRRCRDRMVVDFTFTTTYAISAYHHWRCELEPRSWQGLLDTTLGDKECQCLAAGRLLSPVSSTYKTDIHDITEILLKVALNTKTKLTKHKTNVYCIYDNKLKKQKIPHSQNSTQPKSKQTVIETEIQSIPLTHLHRTAYPSGAPEFTPGF